MIDGAANTMRFLSRKGLQSAQQGDIKKRIDMMIRREASEASGGATGDFYRATGKIFVLNRGDKRQDQASIESHFLMLFAHFRSIKIEALAQGFSLIQFLKMPRYDAIPELKRGAD